MPQTLSLPTTLNDRYAIERELGGGTTAVTYVARRVQDGRYVTLKLLRRELAAGLAGERFLSEIEAVAGLEHPNILPIVDWGRTTGSAEDAVIFCVSPYIEGGSLRQRLERGPRLPLDEALRIAGGVAAALDHAHRQHVTHLRLKPENVLLRDGEPIVDFCVGDRFAGASLDASVGGHGAARAAPYASPELLQAQPADGRADQYSLAVLVYEMLAGRPPFVGPTAAVIFTRALTEPPPRLTAIRVVPRIVERAVHHALSKSPADRFPTVAEFATALHGAPAAPPTHARPRAGPARHPWRLAALSLLAAVVIGGGLVVASRALASRSPASASAHSQLTFSGTATAPELSPDGRSLLYIARGRTLVARRLDRADSVTLVPSARSIAAARWTGDGRAVVVAMTRDSAEQPATFVVPVGGGAPRKLLDDVRPFDTGPDSTLVVRAAGDAPRIDIVSLASGATVRSIMLTGPVGPLREVAWSPDGRWIAFTASRSGVLWVVAAEGGLPNRVAGGARAVRWGGDSDALYFLSGPTGTVDLVRVALDPRSGHPAGAPTRVTSLLAADQFDVAGDDRIVHAQTNRGAQLRTFVLATAGRTRRLAEEQALAEGTARLEGGSISPDGLWVAYVATRAAERDLHVVAFGGGSPRVLAASPGREDAPAWSPDGSRLTFTREDSAGRAVFIADARSGAGRRVGSLPASGLPGAAARWAALGGHVAYYAQDSRRVVLVSLQRERESLVRLPESVGTGDAFVVPSPDGTQLMARTRLGPDGQPALWFVFGGGRRWRRIEGPSGDMSPIAWHRDGWIYLVRNTALATDHGAVHLELWRMRGPNGRPELFAPLPEGCGLPVAISTDASRGVCSYVRVESDLYVASGLEAAQR